MNKSHLLTALAAATKTARLYSNEEPSEDTDAHCIEVLTDASLETNVQEPASYEGTFVGDTVDITKQFDDYID
jgi:hypothetical protein